MSEYPNLVSAGAAIPAITRGIRMYKEKMAEMGGLVAGAIPGISANVGGLLSRLDIWGVQPQWSRWGAAADVIAGALDNFMPGLLESAGVNSNDADEIRQDLQKSQKTINGILSGAGADTQRTSPNMDLLDREASKVLELHNKLTQLIQKNAKNTEYSRAAVWVLKVMFDVVSQRASMRIASNLGMQAGSAIFDIIHQYASGGSADQLLRAVVPHLPNDTYSLKKPDGQLLQGKDAIGHLLGQFDKTEFPGDQVLVPVLKNQQIYMLSKKDQFTSSKIKPLPSVSLASN